MMHYIVEVNICWFLFYMFYRLIISKGAYYHVHRWYILSTLVLGLVLPLLQFLQWKSSGTMTAVHYLLPTVNVGFLQEGVVEQIIGLNWIMLFWLLYWSVVAVLLLRIFLGASYLYRLYITGDKQNVYGMQLIVNDHLKQPFSFFKSVFVPTDVLQDEHIKKHVLLHEKTHVRSWHSADVLFVETLSVFFWFSPFIWLLKRELKDAHEFEADAAVLRHADLMEYGKAILLFYDHPVMKTDLSSRFNGSRIKRRFERMASARKSAPVLVQYLLMLPLMMFMVLALSFTGTNAKTLNIDDEKMVTYAGESKELEQYLSLDTIPIGINDAEVYTKVDQMPTFPGGERALLMHLVNHIRYPAEAREKGIQGTVVVAFIVDESGKLSDLQVLRSVGGGCDEETIRVVRQMPVWEPGVQNGEKVKVKYTLPVKFKLDAE
jgi:TonB family protein